MIRKIGRNGGAVTTLRRSRKEVPLPQFPLLRGPTGADGWDEQCGGIGPNVPEEIADADAKLLAPLGVVRDPLAPGALLVASTADGGDVRQVRPQVQARGMPTGSSSGSSLRQLLQR